MDYQYTTPHLSFSEIANQIYKMHPKRLSAEVFDVEGVIEDIGITILPRNLHCRNYLVDGFCPRNQSIIVISQVLFNATNRNRLRFTLAEELAHRILENKLWDGGEIPKGATAEELSEEDHNHIEADARSLAAEILMPAESFQAKYTEFLQRIENDSDNKRWKLVTVCNLLSGAFSVSPLSVSVRMRELGIISQQEYRDYFPAMVPCGQW